MKSTILYPFTINQDNKYSYVQTMQLAKKMAAEVICFTSVSEDKDLDEAYLNLLSLYGHFQTKENDWQASDISLTRIIRVGLFKNELAQYLKDAAVDMLICQPPTSILEESFLYELVKENEHSPKLITFKSDQ